MRVIHNERLKSPLITSLKSKRKKCWGQKEEKGEKQSLRLKKGAIRVTYKNEADRKIYDDRRGGSASIRPLYIAASQIQSTGIHAEFAFSCQKLLLFSRPKGVCFI